MRYSILTLCAVVGLTANLAFAQWTKSISVGTSYDDNAFRNHAALSDYATQLSAYLARDYGSENWQSRLFYRGSFSIFAEYDERSYHYHQIGIAWSRILSEKGNSLNFGVNGSLRANGEVYDYYNFKDASGYGNVKLKIGPSSLTNLGYRLRGRRYSNLPELDYTEHYFFTRFTHFFQTKTTFMIEGNYGRKTYREQVTDGSFSQWDMDDYGHHQGGRGHWNGWSQFDENSTVNSKPSVGQLLGQIRLAQSITNTTGLSTEFVVRRNPGDGIRYLSGQVSGYTTEDELFDDRYGYESEEVGATLTQLLPWQVTFKAGLESKWKNYVDRPALDLNGETLPTGELRKDKQLLTWLSLTKSFTMLGGKSVSLMGEFYWIDNKSNDLYYDYQVSLISLGITTSF